MVTKHNSQKIKYIHSLILAKIHMVTKRKNWFGMQDKSLILAKIHMVTKLMLKI